MLRNILIAVAFLIVFSGVLYFVGVDIALMPSIALTVIATIAVYGVATMVNKAQS